MGGTITTISNLNGSIKDKSISEKWNSIQQKKSIEEKISLFVQVLNQITNGMYCGMNEYYDYMFIEFNNNDHIEQMYQGLKNHPELKGLSIKKETHNVTGGYKDGIEIRPFPKPPPLPTFPDKNIGIINISGGDCIITGSNIDIPDDGCIIGDIDDSCIITGSNINIPDDGCIIGDIDDGCIIAGSNINIPDDGCIINIPDDGSYINIPDDGSIITGSNINNCIGTTIGGSGDCILGSGGSDNKIFERGITFYI